MKIPPNQNKEFFLIPEGEHKAILVQIIDLGTQVINSAEYGPSEKRRVRLTWELPEVLHVFNEEKGEQPAFIMQEYTLSLHQKATFRKHLGLLRGKTIKDEEVEEFDTNVLLGQPCYLTIEHNEYKENTFANIMNLRKGDFKTKPVNELVEFSIDSFDKEVFDKLSEKTQEKVRKSPEYQNLDLNEPNPNPPMPNNDEDLPF